MVRHFWEWWPVYVLVALVVVFIGFVIYDTTSFSAACEKRGGLVWQRDGRACLLPPYNRVEM